MPHFKKLFERGKWKQTKRGQGWHILRTSRRQSGIVELANHFCRRVGEAPVVVPLQARRYDEAPVRSVALQVLVDRVQVVRLQGDFLGRRVKPVVVVGGATDAGFANAWGQSVSDRMKVFSKLK